MKKSEKLDVGKHVDKVGGFVREFKDFAMKGNVLDMAVGVIIGGAFGKIVSSLVSDVVMPLIGGLTGGFDFKTLVWHVVPAREVTNPAFEAARLLGSDTSTIAETILKPAVDVNYGMFIQNFVDFILIAFSIFLFIKFLSKLKRKEEKVEEAPAPAPAPEPEKPEDVKLLEEIRDLLKKN